MRLGPMSLRQRRRRRPNPFASREMPAGIGGAAQPAPAPEPESVPTAGTMDAADIFGSFGISFEDVKEEH